MSKNPTNKKPIEKNNTMSFGGFKKEGIQQEKDLPPRPMPQQMPTKEDKEFWIPQDDILEDQPKNDTKNKIFVAKLVTTLIPLIGIGLLIGSISAVVYIMIQVYQ